MIGAGKSGLIACKVLKERGIPFDCFEAASQVRASIAFYQSSFACYPGYMQCALGQRWAHRRKVAAPWWAHWMASWSVTETFLRQQ